MDKDLEFRSFFEAESDRLRRLAAFLTDDPDRAADLAQEAMARTYRHWGRIRGGAPGPYARRILVNLIRSAHRRRLLERKHPPDLDVITSESPRVDEWLRVTHALSALSPIRRAVIVLRFYEDMTEAEIADVLDRPLGTVKSDLHRALKKLKPMLEETAKETA